MEGGGGGMGLRKEQGKGGEGKEGTNPTFSVPGFPDSAASVSESFAEVMDRIETSSDSTDRLC